MQYYYARNKDKEAAQNLQDVKATDSGRKVYGGGGITPDEKYTGQRSNLFQRRLVPIPGAPDAFYHFAAVYFGTDKPKLPQGWQPNDQVLANFRQYLKDQHIPFSDTDFDANRDWVRDRLQYEFYFRAFDKNTANRAAWAKDPEVTKAIESMPKAEALLHQAQKTYAMRQ
jgi:carboxyl-terminal processing protease